MLNDQHTHSAGFSCAGGWKIMFRCCTHFDLMVALQDSRGTSQVGSYVFNQLPTKCVCVCETASLLATQLMLMNTLDSQWLLYFLYCVGLFIKDIISTN